MKLVKILLISLIVAGCTVVPKPIKVKQASFDGSQQNSGLIGYAPDGSGIITPHKRDTYNRLMLTYGARFPVPLTFDTGISWTPTNAFLIDAEHLVDLGMMEHYEMEK